MLILNADPVFQDKALAIFDMMEEMETRIVRTLSEAIAVLIDENFDAFVVEGETPIAIEQATNARQHFPSLKILCLVPHSPESEAAGVAEQQDITVILSSQSNGRLTRVLRNFVRSLERPPGPAAEGIDPCHSLIGNLNQFSAAEILQMSCLSQRSGRFTFKSGRGQQRDLSAARRQCVMPFSVRSKANRPWPRFSGGGRAAFILKKGSSARCKRSIGRGRTC